MFLPVVPLSKGQLLDVRSEDVLCNGLFRICHTERGGGGYDKFPAIAENRGYGSGFNKQFIVQLHGCTMDCPYCYVTREGVWGQSQQVPLELVLQEFKASGANVFHLMGGAPAMHLQKWPYIINTLYKEFKSTDFIFHSDFVLNERRYDRLAMQLDTGTPIPIMEVISAIQRRCLFAVNIKGVGKAEFEKNTRRPYDLQTEILIFANLDELLRYGIPFYITFTDVSEENIAKFWRMCADRYDGLIMDQLQRDAYSIDLIQYKAIVHVDDIQWRGIHSTR